MENKKKLGRPPVGRTKITSSFSILKENIEFIEEVAQKNGISRSRALDDILFNVQREAIQKA